MNCQKACGCTLKWSKWSSPNRNCWGSVAQCTVSYMHSAIGTKNKTQLINFLAQKGCVNVYGTKNMIWPCRGRTKCELGGSEGEVKDCAGLICLSLQQIDEQIAWQCWRGQMIFQILNKRWLKAYIHHWNTPANHPHNDIVNFLFNIVIVGKLAGSLLYWTYLHSSL